MFIGLISAHPKRGESGFVLPLSAVVLFILVVYAAVILSQARNNKERTRLHATVISMLQAAANAGPEAGAYFEAACNNLYAMQFRSADLTCDSAADFIEDSGTLVRQKIYSDVVSSDQKIRCDQIKFRYTPGSVSGSATTPTLPTFAIDMTCHDRALEFLETSITQIGATGSITIQPVVGYMAIDYSSSLSDIFMTQAAPGSPLIPVIPPSFVTLGNDNYFGQNSTPPSARFYSEPDSPSCPGCLGLPPEQVLRQVIDMQPVGIREYLDPTDGKLIRPIVPPFSTKEIDFVGNTIPATELNDTSEVDNPDNLDGNVLASMPDLIRTGCATPACGPDGRPDPIQYISQNPHPFLIEGTMRRWWAPALDTDDFVNASGESLAPALFSRMRTHARGGLQTSTNLADRCFGAFELPYKQAAQLLLYLFGRYRLRAGVLGFNNWIAYPFLPLFPQQYFEDPASPLYNKRVTEISVGGPPPGSLPPNPNPDESSTDFVAQQFGYTYDQGVDLMQRASVCARELSHDVLPEPELVRYPYKALPNPYEDPSSPMPTFIDTSCTSAEVRYTFPLVFGKGGQCFRDVDQAFFPINCPACPHTAGFCCKLGADRDITPVCSDPGTFKGSLPLGSWGPDADDAFHLVSDPGNGVIFKTLQGIVDPPEVILRNGAADLLTPGDIRFPYRWCKQNPPNIAVGIQSTIAGAFSKDGFQKNETIPGLPRPAEPVSIADALSFENFPAKTSVPNTFTPGAALIAKRALEDPYLAPVGARKLMVLFTDGAPQVSLSTIVNEPGRFQTVWFAEPPTASEVPDYNGPGMNEESRAVLQTMHILHGFIDNNPGAAVLVVLLSSGVGNQNLQNAFVAAMNTPNARPGDNPGAINGDRYNFCKASFLLPGLLNTPGEQQVSAQTCNPEDPHGAEGFHIIRIIKQADETYEAYRIRAFTQIINQAGSIISNAVLSK